MKQASINLVEFNDERKYIKDFLSIPKKLYTRKDNMEDPKTVRSILLGEHALSKYFSLNKFLVYRDGAAVGRFVITTYDDDKSAYIGFFECIDDDDIAEFLFNSAYDFCKSKGFEKIVGPVDASFWIKYRLKINRFDTAPYTGEPYNKDYYPRLFKNNGYVVTDHYVSNDYAPVPSDFVNKKFQKRFKDFTESGFEIKSPTDKTYSDAIGSVYRMIIELYSSFPAFKYVSEEDFRSMFNSYKSIMNMEMTKIAYYNGEAVGFYISIPNYGNVVYHLTPLGIAGLLKTKKNPLKYIMLYMGVEKKHLGLGGALIYSVMEELKKNKLPSIGALCHDGKVTQSYVHELITDSYEYVLMERKLV